MRLEEFCKALKARFPEVSFEFDGSNAQALTMHADGVPQVLQWLRDDPDTKMQFFEFCTAVDHPPTHLTVVYYLYSYEKKHRLALKVDVPRDNPTLPTVSHLWENADWNEREVYDLFGVFFVGHRDLRRIMMPEDWEGHPLRKDYSHPNLALRPD